MSSPSAAVSTSGVASAVGGDLPGPDRAVRRPHAPVAVGCAVGAAAVTWGSFEVVAGLAVGFAMFAVPGVFVADLVAPRDAVERLVVVVAISVTSWMLVAHLLLTFQWWEPRLVVAVLLAVAAAVACRGRDGEPTTARPSMAEWGPTGWIVVAGFAILGGWAWSLGSIDLSQLDGWGFVSVAPLSWFVAFGSAVVLAALVASSPGASAGRVAISIAPLLVVVYGTMPMLVDTLRYPWSYKHIGVVRLLDVTGRFHPDVDIYNNFSGFFGVVALHRGATGVDPTAYGAWTQLVAEALIACAVWLLARRATDSARVAHIATVLYVITNWVGQNYFAAQTLGSFLGLTVLALVASWLLSGATRRLPGVGSWLDGLAPRTSRSAVEPIAARRAVVLFVVLGLMMTHPLTPAAVFGAIAAAAVIGWVRDARLLVGMVLVAAAWFLRSLPYFAAQEFDLGFGGSPTANADGVDGEIAAPAAVELVGQLTRAFSLGIWLLAGIGAALAAWAMRRAGMVLLAAVIPFGILVAQSYGGEAIYRVYLYSLPLVVALIAWGIASRSALTSRRGPSTPQILTVLTAVVLGAGFLIAHYGREQINLVDGSEVAMGDYINAEVADPAVLAQLDGTYPAAGTERYPSFQVNDTYVPMVSELLDGGPYVDRLPPVEALDEVADDLIALDAGVPYLIISPGMIDSLVQSGELPLKSTAEAAELMLRSNRYTLRHRIDETYLLEVLP